VRTSLAGSKPTTTQAGLAGGGPWLLVGDRQYVTFVDPKGIRNLQGENDPKIEFHSTIKEIEDRLGGPEVTLNSFIISNTSFDEVAFWGYTKDELEERHVLFQSEDTTTYIRAMLDRILSEKAVTESAM